MYVWAEIRVSDSDGKVSTIQRGASVSADDIGGDKDEFDSLVESGVIREQSYPKDLKDGETATTYFFRKANETMENAEAAARGEAPVNPSAEEQAAAADTINNSAGVSAGSLMGGVITPDESDENKTDEENKSDEPTGSGGTPLAPFGGGGT